MLCSRGKRIYLGLSPIGDGDKEVSDIDIAVVVDVGRLAMDTTRSK